MGTHNVVADSLPAQRGHRVRVDSGSGDGRSSGPSLASDHRSFCDSFKPLVVGVLCSDGGPSVGGNGCCSSMLGPSSSLRIPSVPHCSPGSQQVSGVGELRVNSRGSVVASTGMVSRSSASSAVSSDTLANSSGPSSATSFPLLQSQSAVAGSSRVETVRLFAHEWGVSGAVGRQLANCHRPSSQRLYQHRWLAYRHWCHSKGHTVSSPSVSKIADFLLFLRCVKGLSVSAVKGFRSMLTSVFKYHLPELSDHFFYATLFVPLSLNVLFVLLVPLIGICVVSSTIFGVLFLSLWLQRIFARLRVGYFFCFS